jgi:peptide/nickel transport system substrate-binding protein
LFAGESDLLGWPLTNQPELKIAYLPLAEAPASVQELWKYNPDKAKQLLAEAGYPNGFKTKLTVDARYADDMSVIQSMWAKVGVNVAIDPKETGVMNTIRARKSQEELIYSIKPNSAAYIKFTVIDGTGPNNVSAVDDPVVKKAKAEAQQYYARLDEVKFDQIYREMLKYVLDQAWCVPFPAGYNYVFWWPWLKNYHGELSVGYDNTPNWAKFVWIDRDLKQRIGR